MADDQRDLPPIDWFRDPGLTEPTPITITADGRVYGHIAAWDASHTAFPGRNVKPPRSRQDYGFFHVGGAEVAGDDGAPTEISVGKLCMNAGHAPLTSDADEAKAFYDDTATIAALCCAGEDASGIWFAGAIEPSLDEVSRRRFRAGAVSGDWRSVNGGPLELIAASVVPTPGFNIPRARVASADPGDLAPLVAAGIVVPVQVAAQSTDAAPAPKKSPDLTTAKTPEEILRMSDQHTPEPDDTDDDESLAAASGGNPFAKGSDDTPDASDGGGDYEAGDTVMLEGVDIPMQVVGQNDDGSVVIEASVPSDQLSKADEAMAAAAYARFDERQQDRVRDAQAARMAASQKETSEQLAAVTAALSSVTEKLEGLEADKRAETARELLASAGIE